MEGWEVKKMKSQDDFYIVIGNNSSAITVNAFVMTNNGTVIINNSTVIHLTADVMTDNPMVGIELGITTIYNVAVINCAANSPISNTKRQNKQDRGRFNMPTRRIQKYRYFFNCQTKQQFYFR